MPNKSIFIFFAKIVLHRTKHAKPVVDVYTCILSIKKMSTILTIKCSQAIPAILDNFHLFNNLFSTTPPLKKSTLLTRTHLKKSAKCKNRG